MKSLSVEPPHAIITVGIAGSGKTFFASKFAETFKAPYIQQEHIEKYTTGEAGTQEIINTMIEQTVRTKQSIVIDVDTSSRASRTSLAKYLRHAGYTPLFVWVQTDKETAGHRTIKRKKITVSEYEQQVKNFSAPHAVEHALVVSGKHTYSSQAKIILKKLSSSRASRQPGQQPVVPPRGKILVR